jgi:DUF4097 and DUF4098 domain-containing protein YvlB
MAYLGIIPLVAATLLAQDPQIARDGQGWKRTYSGVFSGVPSRVIKVSTHGHITVRGSQSDQFTYRLTQHVHAKSEDEAHRIFGTVVTSMAPRNGMTVVTLMPMSRESVNSEWEVSVPRRVAGVLIDTQLGDVEAYDLDSSVRIDTAAGQIRCDHIRGGVEAKTGGGEIRLGKIGGTVQCTSAAGSIFIDSTGGDANCQTIGGEIQIHEASGALTLSTEGGNIQVDKCGGSVQAHTGAGVIQVLQAGGMVFADTRGGSIEVGSSRGAQCQSGAGAIRVKTSTGPLRVQTALGSILAELLAGTRLEDSSLVAGSGDITVLIPSNLALSVLARNETGANPRIVSDFSEVRAKNVGFSRPPLVYEGSINGGGPLLSLNTAAGIIYVRKLK